MSRFLWACRYISKEVDQETFEQDFLPRAVELAKDRVPNVRMSLAELINNHLLSNGNELSGCCGYCCCRCLLTSSPLK